MNALVLSPRASGAFPQPPPLRRLRDLLFRRLPAPARAARMELRIDVQHPEESIETELDTLYRRLHTAADPLSACATLPILLPGLIFRHREADGEHYIYVEDPAAGRLAGYTVFNRLIEVDRRTDRHVRAPHSKYAPAYQGRGIATAVYEWALAQGICLVSGARQSVGAHALWRALGRRHPLRYVAIVDKRLHDLGTEVEPRLREDLNTRMILFGARWSLGRAKASSLLRGSENSASLVLSEDA
ncbi:MULTISPECIES: GNAT family N-acetyltransferase [Pseudomonadota]|uniref:GNAT family N-acetyltransferase n=1 Tax=Pseudomonadota TaxID=1224 RepID=UPI0025799FFA|nr:GNAT family N-acetyltransferase [Thauera sp.]